jgi:hypothetical protein
MPPRESNAISSGRSAAFTSGTGTKKSTVKSVATELAKAAPGAIANAAKREASYLADGDYKVRATGHVVNFASDIVQGIANVGINAVNATSRELSENIGDGRPSAVIPNIRTPKLNVDATTRNVSVRGGSLDRNTKVGTAKSLGFVVEGAPEETVSRVIEGAGLVPFLKPIRAAKGAGKAVTNEVENAVRASAGSFKPKSSKPTFEPPTPGGPTTPKIIRTEEPDSKVIDPNTGDMAPPSKRNPPRTLDKPDGPAKGQEKKNQGTTITKEPPASSKLPGDRWLKPGEIIEPPIKPGTYPPYNPPKTRTPEVKPAPAPKPAPKPAAAPEPRPAPAPAVAPTSTVVRNSTDETARESRRAFPSMGVSPQSSQFTSPQGSTDNSTSTDSGTGTVTKTTRPRNPDAGLGNPGRQDVNLRRIF